MKRQLDSVNIHLLWNITVFYDLMGYRAIQIIEILFRSGPAPVRSTRPSVDAANLAAQGFQCLYGPPVWAEIWLLGCKASQSSESDPTPPVPSDFGLEKPSLKACRASLPRASGVEPGFLFNVLSGTIVADAIAGYEGRTDRPGRHSDQVQHNHVLPGLRDAVAPGQDPNWERDKDTQTLVFPCFASSSTGGLCGGLAAADLD